MPDNVNLLCDVFKDVMLRRPFTIDACVLLPDHLQAPIIVTFHMPADPRFDFARFYDELAARGFVIYPGKLTVADSFRVGCIGRLGAQQMRAALAAIREVLDLLGVGDCAPAAAAA